MNGIVVPEANTVREAAETLVIAEQSGEDVALGLARSNLGVALVHQGGPTSAEGIELLSQVRDTAMQGRFSLEGIQNVDIVAAQERTMQRDFDRAIQLSRETLDELHNRGVMIWIPVATGTLVDALLERGHGDLEEAHAAIERLAAIPIEQGVVVHDIWLLRARALLARAQGDEVSYRDLRDRYRKMATALGFEGHIAWAEAMP